MTWRERTQTLEEEDKRTEAKVTRVVDGDTIEVDIDGETHIVRYIGIDTPETVHPTKGVEPGGPEASEANRRLVAGKTVYLEKDKSDTDRYGRLLRNVFLKDGTFVNAELVRQGHAEVSTYNPDVRYKGMLERLERDSGRAKETSTLGILTRTALKLHVWQENIGKRVLPDEQSKELTRLIQAEQQEGLIGSEQRIKLLSRAGGRKFHGSDWGEAEFQVYMKSLKTHGKESPTTIAAYEGFIEAQGDLKHSLQAADPKHPELEDERGKIFTALLYQEALSGTFIYNLRKKIGFGEIDWIEQTEGDETVKEITPSQALGITTRETRIWTPRGAIGLAVDILLDPLTYESPVGTVGSIGGKVLKIVKAERRAIVASEGAGVVMRQTRWIREQYPTASATEAREAAESLVLDIAHKKDLYAARKYQEPSFSIGGQVLFYWGDVRKLTGALSEKLPYLKKRQAVSESVTSWIGETFEPFYKVGQAAGEYGKDIFKKTIRKVDYERDIWNERARALAKKGPAWWRRKERRDVNEQVLEYIQRGVEPTDPRVYGIADDMVAAQREIAEADIAAGLLDPARLREGYVFRQYTPEFRKEVFEKEFGYRQGDDIAIYERQLESAHRRELHPEMSHKELNEWAMKKYGIQALVTDPAQILRMRGVQSSRARAMANLRRQVGEELGVPEAEVRQHLWKEAQPKHPHISSQTPEEVIEYLKEGQGVDVFGLLTPVTMETSLSAMPKAFEHPIKLTQKVSGKLPDDVMMEGKRKVKHEYTTLSGESRISYVDEDVVAEVTRKEQESIKILSEMERYMRWGYTVPHVAFHSRNIQGILEQNLYYGVSPEDYAMNWQILYGDPKQVFDIPGYGKMQAGAIKEMYHEAGILGKLGYIEDPTKFKELPMGPMRPIEDVGRGALATKLLMAGKGIDEAAHAVRITHFEYGAAGLTQREQKIGRHAFLFYTWPKKNIELTTKMLGQQPGVAGGMSKFQQAWITPEEYSQLPEWAKESYVLTYDGKFYILDVPYLNALQLMTGDGYGFAHTPLLKFYMGAAFGIDPTTGRRLDLSDMPEWAAEAGVGRFVSLHREFGKMQAGEIPASQMVMHQVGGMYVKDLDTDWFEPARFEATKRHQPSPSKEQKYAAWIKAGSPEDWQIKILRSPPPGMAGTPPLPQPKWWEVWKKSPEEAPPPDFELSVLTPEQYEVTKGFKPTEEQLQYIFSELEGEPLGSREARHAELAAKWQAFKSGKMQLEQPTTEQEMESWRRAGLAPGQKYTQKIYRDELGKLLGVGTYTPEELEEMGGFTPSETQAEWAFRSTRKMKPVTQFKAWAEEHKTQQEQERQMQEELAGIAIGAPIKLQKHDPFIPLGLTMTTRRARRRELEEMLGEGVDR